MASKRPECPICCESYNDRNKCPRMLSCGHSFCSSCLQALLHGNTINCPICRNPSVVPSGIQRLLKNFALLDIVNDTPKENVVSTSLLFCEACDEKHPANFCCLDCKEDMCTTAAQFHKRNKASREHRVFFLEELKANPQLASISVLCPEHNDPFRFFDEDCGIVICRDCHSLYHSGHNCVEVAEAASKYRQEMEALVTKASSQAEKIKAAEAQVRGASVSMKEACEEQLAEIHVFFRQLRAAVNSREQVLVDKLVSLLQHKESILSGQQDRLRVNRACLKNAVQQAKSSIQSPSDVQFLLSRPVIVSSLKTKESYSLVLEPEAQFLPEFTKEEKEEKSVLGIRSTWSPFRKGLDCLEEAIHSAGAISDRSTCAANSTAIGKGTERANVGKKATFTIISRDSQNRQRIQGGDVYAVKLKKSVNDLFGYNTTKVDVKDQNDGTYLAEYTVHYHYPSSLVGVSCRDYTLSVFLGGVHIKGSPFVVRVTRS